MRKYLKLMRVHHWLKNGLVYMALIFGGKLLERNLFLIETISFFAFSLAASCVYIINDLSDIEKDKLHPIKCKRPLASGEIKKSQAYILLIVTFFSSIILTFCVTKNIVAFSVLIGYIVINIFYSKVGKNIALLDILILVVGYILRIYFGGIIVGVPVSGWLYLTVTFMGFYLSLGKRRNELRRIGTNARGVLSQYTENFLDKNMYMCLGLTIMFYSLWCENVNTTKGSFSMLLTVPFVMIICMRYSLDIEKMESDGDPMQVLLADKILLILIGIYGLLLMGLVYLL